MSLLSTLSNPNPNATVEDLYLFSPYATFAVQAATADGTFAITFQPAPSLANPHMVVLRGGQLPQRVPRAAERLVEINMRCGTAENRGGRGKGATTGRERERETRRGARQGMRLEEWACGIHGCDSRDVRRAARHAATSVREIARVCNCVKGGVDE